MNKKGLAGFFLALALIVLGYWAVAGMSLWTFTERKEIIKEKDDFGDEVERVVWHKEFVPGLGDLAGPIAGLCVVAAGVLFWLDRKGRAQRT